MNNIKLSIILASNRPNKIQGFLSNIQRTLFNHNFLEVLIAVDRGDKSTISAINNIKENLSYKILIYERKVKGKFNLVEDYNYLLKKCASKTSYFFWNITDEIRFKTKHWDKSLIKYIGLYKDDIFRLNVSLFKTRQHKNLLEAVSHPENYPITTRKWLQMVDGWGNLWGTDSWQGGIYYYLNEQLLQHELSKGIYHDSLYQLRSIPIYDFELDGVATGQEDLNSKLSNFMSINCFNILTKYKSELEFQRLATRLYAYIYAYSILNLKKFYMYEDFKKSKIILLNSQKKFILSFYYKKTFLLVIKSIFLEKFYFIKFKLSASLPNFIIQLFKQFKYQFFKTFISGKENGKKLKIDKANTPNLFGNTNTSVFFENHSQIKPIIDLLISKVSKN